MVEGVRLLGLQGGSYIGLVRAFARIGLNLDVRVYVCYKMVSSIYLNICK